VLSLKNDRLLRVLRRQPVDRTPIWIMRQAGRYLPEYRATRARAGNFMALCQTPVLACEVTLQPLARYSLDAAIIFSDILTIPDAMGLGLTFIEGKGPLLAKPVHEEKEIERLRVPDLNNLRYVYEAIHLVQSELAGKVPLIGFCGSPWTLAAYMVEGAPKVGFPRLCKMLKEAPLLLHKLLNVLEDSVFIHLHAQIEAGVQVVMIFDTWGELLDVPDYTAFSLCYVKRIITKLLSTYNNRVPVILFTKNGYHRLEQLADTGCQAVGVDWKVPLHEARQRIGERVVLQGNLNPACLLATPAVIRNEVSHILDSFGHGSGHIFNLGHGITPNVPPEHVTVLVEAVHELSATYHAKEAMKDSTRLS
jgi:uroporphyrinogen decarboxylase